MKKSSVKAHIAIHSAAAAAGAVGAGLAKIPCSDNLIITPIQLAMTLRLGKIHTVDLSKATAKAALASAAAAMIGKVGARVGTQLLCGWVPVAGSIINASTAAGLTEAIGWYINQDFEKRSAA